MADAQKNLTAEDLALIDDQDQDSKATAAGSADDVAQKVWDEFEAVDKAASDDAAPAIDVVDAETPAESGKDDDDPATGDKPAADTKKTKDTPDESGTADAAPDIWENATPEQKTAFLAATATADTARQEAHRAHGTVSGLQKKINTLEAAEPAPASGGEAGTGADEDDGSRAPKSASIFDTPEFMEAKDEYPEVLGPVENAFKALEGQIADIKGEVGGLSEHRVVEHVNQQYGIVVREHPDYDVLADSDEFQQWYETAPEYVRDGVMRNGEDVVNGLEVADIVTKFKAETGWVAPKEDPADAADAGGADSDDSPAPDKGAEPNTAPTDPKRKAQLESAKTPRPKGAPAASHQEPPDDADPQVHWDYFERLDKQKEAAAQ